MASKQHSQRMCHIVTKWVGFVTAIWVQAIAGNNYGFSNYSVALKAVGSYNQVQLNNLGVAKDMGKALGLLAGFASDFLPPWTILLIGSVEGLLGYGAQWLVLSNRVAPLPYWQMCILLCMGGNSTTWMNTAVLVTCIRNFCHNRGPVVGILKGYIGLSTAIFTVLCSSLFSSDPAVFVLLLAIIPFAICVIAMLFLRPVPPAESKAEQEEERKSLFLLNVAATALAVYLLVYDFVGAFFSGKLFALVLLLLLATPLYVPARLFLLGLLQQETGRLSKEDLEDPQQPLLEEDNESTENQQQQESEVGDEQQGRPSCSSSGSSHEDLAKASAPELGQDHNPWQAFRKVEFWLLFMSLMCGMGTGTVVINNLGQIGETLGYKDVSSFVSLTSVWGFFGRIGSGLVSEHYLRSTGIPRPAWLAASQLLMITGFVMLISTTPGGLYIGSSIVGLCYGVRLAITVPTASELFGLKYFGLIYNILIINIPLGSFLFSGLLAGSLYDYEAGKVSGIAKSAQFWDGGLFSHLKVQSCMGTHCYRLTFVIMIAVCALGFALDVMLTLITKSYYRSLMISKKGRSS